MGEITSLSVIRWYEPWLGQHTGAWLEGKSLLAPGSDERKKLPLLSAAWVLRSFSSEFSVTAVLGDGRAQELQGLF